MPNTTAQAPAYYLINAAGKIIAESADEARLFAHSTITSYMGDHKIIPAADYVKPVTAADVLNGNHRTAKDSRISRHDRAYLHLGKR